MGEEFNTWMEKNPGVKIFHIFDPVRNDEIYGDRNYNRYNSTLTFFYVANQ